jgi:hypothetical protein
MEEGPRYSADTARKSKSKLGRGKDGSSFFACSPTAVCGVAKWDRNRNRTEDTELP